LEFATRCPKRATATNQGDNTQRAKSGFAMDDIMMIVEARVEELFEYVDKELTDSTPASCLAASS